MFCVGLFAYNTGQEPKWAARAQAQTQAQARAKQKQKHTPPESKYGCLAEQGP